MNKPKPSDAKQVSPGNTVVLLCGSYDPVHLDYLRALEALVPRYEHVWIAPFYDKRPTHVRNMCHLLTTEMASSMIQVGFCTAGIDKKLVSPDEIISWCSHIYPDVTFRVAMIDGFSDDIAIRFFNQPPSSAYTTVDVLYLPQPSDLATKIREGCDMSRSFCPSVWNYIQDNRLYRGIG